MTGGAARCARRSGPNLNSRCFSCGVTVSRLGSRLRRISFSVFRYWTTAASCRLVRRARSRRRGWMNRGMGEIGLRRGASRTGQHICTAPIRGESAGSAGRSVTLRQQSERPGLGGATGPSPTTYMWWARGRPARPDPIQGCRRAVPKMRECRARVNPRVREFSSQNSHWPGLTAGASLGVRGAPHSGTDRNPSSPESSFARR